MIGKPLGNGTIFVTFAPPFTLPDVTIRREGGGSAPHTQRQVSATQGELVVPPGKYEVLVENPLLDDEARHVYTAKVEAGARVDLGIKDKPNRGIVTIQGSEPGMFARLVSAPQGEGLPPTFYDLGKGKYELNARGGKYEVEVQLPEVMGTERWVKTKVTVVNGQSTRLIIPKEVLVQTEQAPSTAGGPVRNTDAVNAEMGYNLSVRGTYIIRMTDLPEIAAAATQLRDRDFNVNVRRDSNSSSKNVADYSVIFIGHDVPADAAKKVILTARPLMPWLKYIYVQEGPGLDERVLDLTAHRYLNSFPFARLTPLSDADFVRLTMAFSDDEFMRLARSFSGDAKASSPKKKK